MDHRSEAEAHATVSARMELLVAELGRPEPAVMAARAFLQRLDAVVADVCTADDAAARDSAAHQLAGSAETLGAMALGAVARDVMRLAREQPEIGLPLGVAERLRLEAGAAAEALRGAIDRLEQGGSGGR